MIPKEQLDKITNITNHVRQSGKARNNPDLFVREVAREARAARLHETIPIENIEGLAAEAWCVPLIRSRKEYPMNVLEVAAQRRNHRLMLKLLRHPDDAMRSFAAEEFQILFAMLDGYYDEASSLVNQILLLPTEIPAVKYALLRDLGRRSRRGLPREIADTAWRLIHDPDAGISFHALRLLSALYDVRDWRAVLDRMLSYVGDDSEYSEHFLSAGLEYLQDIVIYEPEIAEWMKTLAENYPPEHLAVKALHDFVLRRPDMALEAGLINRRDYQQITRT